MLMGYIVVNDQMNIQTLWNIVIDVAQKLKKLLVPVTRLTLGENMTGSYVEGGK